MKSSLEVKRNSLSQQLELWPKCLNWTPKLFFIVRINSRFYGTRGTRSSPTYLLQPVRMCLGGGGERSGCKWAKSSWVRKDSPQSPWGFLEGHVMRPSSVAGPRGRHLLWKTWERQRIRGKVGIADSISSSVNSSCYSAVDNLIFLVFMVPVRKPRLV